MRAHNATGVTAFYEGHSMGFAHTEVYWWPRAGRQLTVRVLAA